MVIKGAKGIFIPFSSDQQLSINGASAIYQRESIAEVRRNNMK